METGKVIEYFKKVCSIPRASGDEEEICDYIAQFAKERGLKVSRDEKNNMVVKKPATVPGCTETVILQGHLDMVYVKSEESVHEYRDGIRVLEDEEYYFAGDTSLGADNGIAAAYCLALLDSKDIRHPNLEVIFTAQEEVGLAGAAAMDISGLKGNMLINLDSEEEGYIYTSCAGGLRCRMFWREDTYTLEGTQYGWHVAFHGLRGGHSGMNIDHGRGNAIVLMGRLLYALRDLPVKVGQIDFPGKANAIPSAGSFMLYADKAAKAAVENKINEMEGIFRSELKYSDHLMIEAEETEVRNPAVYTQEFVNNLVNCIMLLPNGIATVSQAMEGLVESSMNLGSLSMTGGRMELLVMIRSSVASRKYFLKQKLEIIADRFCEECTFENDYPGWEYKKESDLRKVAEDVYKEMFAKSARIAAIHAGLECGYWADKKPDLDIISIGPDLHDVHSVDERASKQSVENVWNFLVALLEKLS